MNKGDRIKLTTNQKLMGAFIGQQRRTASVMSGYEERNGSRSQSPADQMFYNVAGALGEVAFAKGAGLFWPMTLNVGKNEPDVDPDWQVRWRSFDNADLIVRPDDPDHFKYVLITGYEYDYVFRGWILGSEAKKHDEWFRDAGGRDKPVWWVPQGALLSMSKNEP